MIEFLLRKLFRFSTAGPALVRYYIAPHVKLHHIVKDDEDWHTHPWNGISIIFGSYWEYRDGNAFPSRRWLFNRVFAHRPHKVSIDKPVWTLFIHGKRINENWKYGEAVQPWNNKDDAHHYTGM